jgi:hypothetical protein
LPQQLSYVTVAFSTKEEAGAERGREPQSQAYNSRTLAPRMGLLIQGWAHLIKLIRLRLAILFISISQRNLSLEKSRLCPSLQAGFLGSLRHPRPLFLTSTCPGPAGILFKLYLCQWFLFRKIGSFDTVLDKPQCVELREVLFTSLQEIALGRGW